MKNGNNGMRVLAIAILMAASVVMVAHPHRPRPVIKPKPRVVVVKKAPKKVETVVVKTVNGRKVVKKAVYVVRK